MKANILKGEFIKSNLTHKQVADHLGINQSTLSQKLSGARDFSRKECDELRKLLHLDDKTFMEIFFQN